MEHWLAFVETFSAYVFKPGVLGPVDGVLERLWDMIVQIVEHYCRPTPITVSETIGNVVVVRKVLKGTPESASIGAALCLSFATLMEKEDFPHNQFTSNLHLICCRCAQGRAGMDAC